MSITIVKKMRLKLISESKEILTKKIEGVVDDLNDFLDWKITD